MDNGLLSLRGENMCAAYSDAILSSRALLQNLSLCGQGLEFVDEDPLVLSNAGVRLRGARNGGHKLFGEHRRRCVRVCACRGPSSFLP
jgi:hypothetical protein